MSADLLRQAAKVLRERAEAATSGPWRAMDHDDTPGDEGVALLGKGATVMGSHMIGYFHVLSQPEQEANGSYAATMHPGVGLALAALLDHVAEDAESNDMFDGFDPWVTVPAYGDALTIACLIVGGAS